MIATSKKKASDINFIQVNTFWENRNKSKVYVSLKMFQTHSNSNFPVSNPIFFTMLYCVQVAVASGMYRIDEIFLQTFSECQPIYFEYFAAPKNNKSFGSPFAPPQFFTSLTKGSLNCEQKGFPILLELVPAGHNISRNTDLIYPISYYAQKHASSCKIHMVHFSNLLRHTHTVEDTYLETNLKIFPTFLWIFNEMSLGSQATFNRELSLMRYSDVVVLNVINFEFLEVFCMPCENVFGVVQPSNGPAQQTNILNWKDVWKFSQQLNANMRGNPITSLQTFKDASFSTNANNCKLDPNISSYNCIAQILSRKLNFTVVFDKSVEYHGWFHSNILLISDNLIKYYLNIYLQILSPTAPSRYGYIVIHPNVKKHLITEQISGIYKPFGWSIWAAFLSATVFVAVSISPRTLLFLK